jgi:hypothetical protein
LLSVLVVSTAASAETLLMPKRAYRMGVAGVVWGISTNATNVSCSLNFGDGNTQNCQFADRSFIAYTHAYATAGTFTVTLTVNGESATQTVDVYDVSTLSAFDNRALGINMAIQDGLRSMWLQQFSRTNFDTSNITGWNDPYMTGLVILAFENHGFTVPNNNSTPTGLYEKYLVQRGLNYIASQLGLRTLTAQNAGNPCVGGIFDPCVGLSTGNEGYGTAVAALAFAGSNAPNRNIPNGVGNATYVANRPIKEVLQRMINTISWGQIDLGVGQGGWHYSYANNGSDTSDGSVVGWDVLALLDAAAAGTVIPNFVKTEFMTGLNLGQNTDGTFDYNSNGNPATQGGVGGNFARAAINLEGLFYVGQVGIGDSEVAAATNALNIRWDGIAEPGDYTSTCGFSAQNLGCAYSMYNAFKGLKLHGITTMSASTRAAGPGPIPAKDWHAEYEDYLVGSQVNPATTAGGHWSYPFSCCGGSFHGTTGISLLILAPVALIAPDPTLFSTVGLQHGNPLTINPVSNPVGTSHSVTAKAQSSSGAPIPGVTISFQVTGRNNTTGSGVTDGNGIVVFTYLDGGPSNSGGADSIQAFIGAVGSNTASNTLTKNWVVGPDRCDVDDDGDIDKTDIGLIAAANRKNASSSTDPRDGNGDGKINVADQRYCSLLCTLPGCAIPPQ